MTLLENAAQWLSGLTKDDIPDRIEEKVRHQVLNMLAAIMAGIQTGTGKKLINAIPGSGGDVWSYGRGRYYTLEEAIMLNCSLAMILDYDDYLFMGHTGHSSVIASMLLADREGKKMSDCIPAIAASNEIAGRIGASTFFGPRNGQLWSYIHLAGGAAAAAHILGLPQEAACHAMAIALYQPVLPLYPGFMGGESKVTTAATPTQTGVQSAYLSMGGLKGNTAIIEESRGFLDEIAVVRLGILLSGWGRSWVTDTLAFKPYPGCAYLDTALDCWDEIREQLKEDEGKDTLAPEDVEEVVVEASIFTEGMDQLARVYRGSDPLKPININFSIASSMAIAMLSGRVTPGTLEQDYLAENRESILGMMSKVRLVHSWKNTIKALGIIEENLDLSEMLASLPYDQLKSIRRQLKNNSQTPDLEIGKLLREFRLFAAFRRASQHFSFRRRLKREPELAFDLGNVNMEQLRLPFPASVNIKLKDGREYGHYCIIPRGAPGGPTYLEEVREKWMREAAPLLGEEDAGRAMSLILEGDHPVGDILDLLQPGCKQ